MSHLIQVLKEDEAPPGGWRWLHPRAGRIHSRESFPEILGGAQRTLLNLGEDPSLAASQIHRVTAENLMRMGRRDLIEVTKEVPRTAEQLRSGARAVFLKWWKESPSFGLINGKASGGEPVFVDQAEGDRRAAICAGCRHNVKPAGKGWLQSWADGKMLDSVEGRTTASHERLGVCDVCSCELRAAVWWVPDIIAAATRGTMFARNLPGHCWKRQIISSPPAG